MWRLAVGQELLFDFVSIDGYPAFQTATISRVARIFLLGSPLTTTS